MEKDITEKQLEDWNDVFADIVNVLLFNGRRLIQEKELEDATKDTMLKADGKVHEQERDVSKIWKNGDRRFESRYNKRQGKSRRGGVVMGGIFSDIYDEGLSKGLSQGRADGQTELIKKMLDAKFATVEQIADLLKISVEEVQKMLEKAPVLN